MKSVSIEENIMGVRGWVVIENVCGIHKLQTIFERWQKIKQMR